MNKFTSFSNDFPSKRKKPLSLEIVYDITELSLTFSKWIVAASIDVFSFSEIIVPEILKD